MTETKWCPRCSENKHFSEFGVNRARRDGLTSYCIECRRVTVNESRLKRRRLAMEILGGCCARCGFDDERALQIDHIDGSGGQQRRSGAHAGEKVIRSIIKGVGRDQFQLLCANCNYIKIAENNERLGKRVYKREIPVERVVRPNARWTPEQRAAQSAKTKAMWEDPEARAAFMAGEKWTPERRAAHSEQLKAMWKDPEKRAALMKAQEASHRDPRIREIRSRAASENMRKRWASGEVPNKRRTAG